MATNSQPSSSESTVQTSDSRGPNASVAARLWGLLMLIGLPWTVLVAGFLQIISGTSIRHYGVGYSAMALPLRLGIALAAIALSILAAGVAAWIA